MSDVQPLSAEELLNPARVERMRHEASTNGRPGLLIDNDIVVAMCEAIQSHGRQAETIRELKAALEGVVSLGRLSNYAELLAAGETIEFSPELRELAAAALTSTEARG